MIAFKLKQNCPNIINRENNFPISVASVININRAETNYHWKLIDIIVIYHVELQKN